MILVVGLTGAALLPQPAAAQQATPGTGRAPAPSPLNLQPPTPPLFPPPGSPGQARGGEGQGGGRAADSLAPHLAGPPETPDCAPAWPCRFRLFGEIEKFGGVGLKATALTW